MTYLLGTLVIWLCLAVIFRATRDTRRPGVDWLHIGELELELFGHLSEEARQKISRLWATGNAETRAKASSLLDKESFMHAGHERLAKIEELSAKLQMMELKEKLALKPELPAWKTRRN